MSKWFHAVIALFLLVVPAQAQRLPTTVVPEHYDLWFAPDLEKETFRGRETIEVVLTERATSVTLNAAEIEFGEVTITSGGRTQTARVTTDAKNETATLTVPQPLAEGKATVQISYTGILNDKLRGFYISKANGRKYAVTQLEATDARRAFPSFDEPVYKATFDVSLMVDAGDVAISNGRQLSDTPGPEPGKHTLKFARTPKMSSYLVAMLVGDFACRAGASDGIAIRICSTPDKRDLTAFALEATQFELKFFNEYFGIKYPFEKLDVIGVPDFAAGAMENAGAITFRERLLLVDPKQSSLTARKNVAAVLSHEIAHQWFGDLVTMKWWDDIWLNEGFATWMANKPLAAWRPEWQVELMDAVERQQALSLDSLRSTRPIRTKVETADQINQVFDAIAYEKTAAVLRMIETYIGPESFRKGITSYLKRYSYANAAGEDFWNEIARVSGRPVDRIMKSYVDQAGAPVLTIRNKCVGSSSEVAVTQGRFVGAPGESPATQQTWTVPVCFKTSGGQPRCELLDRREPAFTVASCGNVFANADSRGYYLSEYSPDAVREFAKNINGLKPVERIALTGDEWRMAWAGRHDIDVYLDLVGADAGEDAAAVVGSFADRLETVGDALTDKDNQSRYQAWIRARFGPVLAAMGVPGDAEDSDERQSRRATLLGIVGITGNDPEVQRRARELANMYLADPLSLPPTLASPVLQVAAVGGDERLYEQYLSKLAKSSAQPEEYHRFLNALTSFRDPSLVRRTLDLALSPTVRSQDTGTIISLVMFRPWGHDAAWEFTKKNWPELVKKLGVFQGIPEIVGTLGIFCSAQAAADIKEFFAKNPVPAVDRTLQQAVERIDICVAVRERQARPLAAWLRAQS